MNIKQAKRLRYLICHLAQDLASANRKGGRGLQGRSHVQPLKTPLGRGAIQYKELLVEVMILLTLHTASEGSLSPEVLQLRAGNLQALLYS